MYLKMPVYKPNQVSENVATSICPLKRVLCLLILSVVIENLEVLFTKKKRKEKSLPRKETNLIMILEHFNHLTFQMPPYFPTILLKNQFCSP